MLPKVIPVTNSKTYTYFINYSVDLSSKKLAQIYIVASKQNKKHLHCRNHLKFLSNIFKVRNSQKCILCKKINNH